MTPMIPVGTLGPVRIVIALLLALASVHIAFAQAIPPGQGGIVTREQEKGGHNSLPCRVHVRQGEGSDSRPLFPSAIAAGCVETVRDTLRIPSSSGEIADSHGHNIAGDLFGQNPGTSLESRQSLTLGITTSNATVAREPRKLFDRLTFSSDLPQWPAAHGYTIDSSTLVWKFVTSASYGGPAGLRFGVTAVGRRSYGLPVFATQLIGSDVDHLPVIGSMLSMQSRAVDWNAIFRIERALTSRSAVDIKLVGEAFTPLGRDNELNGTSPERNYLRSRAIRFGVVLTF